MGAYTGNAIASIACTEPVAVVDANVVRVVSRLRRLAGAPLSKASVLQQTALADALLDPQRPGDFNQVLTYARQHLCPECVYESAWLRGLLCSGLCDQATARLA